jgi:uncharacterized protein YbjT (DUF2867 family)
MEPGTRAERVVTVFGGTGLLGWRVVCNLADKGLLVQSVSRHPGRTGSLKGSALQPIRADINNEDAIAAAIAGAYAVVNAVSLYRERGSETFHARVLYTPMMLRVTRVRCGSHSHNNAHRDRI